MVVLEHHPVAQVAAVVPGAAGPDGGLLERPQARRGLAGVPDPERRGGVDERPGAGGDAAQVAEEVEGRALGREDRGQRTGHDAEDLPGRDLLAVVDLPDHVDLAVDLAEGLRGARGAGDDAVGAHHELRPALGRCRQERRAQVSQRQEVLVERPADQIGDHTCGCVVGAGDHQGHPTGWDQTMGVPPYGGRWGRRGRRGRRRITRRRGEGSRTGPARCPVGRR